MWTSRGRHAREFDSTQAPRLGSLSSPAEPGDKDYSFSAIFITPRLLQWELFYVSDATASQQHDRHEFELDYHAGGNDGRNAAE